MRRWTNCWNASHRWSRNWKAEKRGKASSMDEQVALMEKSYELAAKYMGGQNGGQPSRTEGRADYRAESRKEHGKTRKAGDASGGVLARTAHE